MLFLNFSIVSDPMSCRSGPDDFFRRPSVFYSTLETVGIYYKESSGLLGEAPDPPAGYSSRRICLLVGSIFLLAGLLAMVWWICNTARVGQQTD